MRRISSSDALTVMHRRRAKGLHSSKIVSPSTDNSESQASLLCHYYGYSLCIIQLAFRPR